MTQSHSADRADTTRIVHDTITAILPGVPREEIRGDRHLKDLGADSVDRVEILLSLVERLGVTEPLSRFSDVPDVDALIDLLRATRRR
ncbi:phosphopantetheine-binding protein [Streptomyces sp. NPDC057148]|uniref:phosphopantetheine-binding protein n=1 Tax=unclassified Streptomyces TaxID=2593676 RepID=UPI0036369258